MSQEEYDLDTCYARLCEAQANLNEMLNEWHGASEDEIREARLEVARWRSRYQRFALGDIGEDEEA